MTHWASQDHNTVSWCHEPISTRNFFFYSEFQIKVLHSSALDSIPCSVFHRTHAVSMTSLNISSINSQPKSSSELMCVFPLFICVTDGSQNLWRHRARPLMHFFSKPTDPVKINKRTWTSLKHEWCRQGKPICQNVVHQSNKQNLFKRCIWWRDLLSSSSSPYSSNLNLTAWKYRNCEHEKF